MAVVMKVDYPTQLKAMVLDTANGKILHQFDLPTDPFPYLTNLEEGDRAPAAFLDLKNNRLIVGQNRKLQVMDLATGTLLAEHSYYEPYLGGGVTIRKAAHKILMVRPGRELALFDYKTLDYRDLAYLAHNSDRIVISEDATQVAHFGKDEKVYIIDTTKP